MSSSLEHPWYRTLVFGQLRQESGLSVGGTAPVPGCPDIQCARDGQGRLTIPGTGLAGALVETIARIVPEVLTTAPSQRPLAWRRVSGKAERLPSRQEAQAFLQSALRVYPSHLADAPVEIRQGVGIRQATAATAVEQKALFDLETVPAGGHWGLFLEIDTLRGGPEVEALVLLALGEWMRGRCWLGGGAARGTGWMRLDADSVAAVRLPLNPDAVTRWPDNTLPLDNPSLLLDRLQAFPGSATARGDAILDWIAPLRRQLPATKPFRYAILDVEFAAGPDPRGYGWDSLSVGGHLAATLEPLAQNLAQPCGIERSDFEEAYNPDHPVVTTQPLDGRKDAQRPFVPGSGVRGALRHQLSALLRGAGMEVVDPNQPGSPCEGDDPVSKLFGLSGHSARLLVRDACVRSGGAQADEFTLAWMQHHAEDEFTAGVWGHSKFDRTAVLQGTFALRLVIEAASPDELAEQMQTLLPGLRLAELGMLPLGGGKWRGHGWLPWRFRRVTLATAGRPEEPTWHQGQDYESIADAVAELRVRLCAMCAEETTE